MRHPTAFSLVLMLTVTHLGFAAEENQQNQTRQGRITFEQFSTRQDRNGDGKVERDEFNGEPQFFRWLDQNGDGIVTAEEFQKRTQRDGHQRPGGGRRVPESDVGGNLDQSSRVHAIVDLFGPSDLGLFAEKSERFRHNKTPELLKSASPVTYLTNDDPPLLILHGDKGGHVPLGQSEHIDKRYQEAGLKSSLHVVEGAGHGGPQFSDSTRYELVKQFLDRHIKQTAAKGG